MRVESSVEWGRLGVKSCGLGVESIVDGNRIMSRMGVESSVECE